MKKISKNKMLILLKIIIMVIMFMAIFKNITLAFALNELTGTNVSNTELTNKGNEIITIVTTIGSVVSVIVLIILGLKYMLGSVEEKAQYKKTMMPYLIGAAFVFAASAIAGMVYSFAIHIGE